jgi:murein L,D-transpeptidase YcbB/YkuD
VFRRLLLLLVSAAPAVAAERPVAPDPVAEIRGFLEGNGSPQPLCATPEGRAVWSAVQAFYSGREYQPVWTDAGGVNPAGSRLLAALAGAEGDGVSPSTFGVPGDAGLTVAFLHYASILGQGQAAPPPLPFWRPIRRTVDLVAVLERAAAGDPQGALAAARPWHPQHGRLAEALARYRALAAREGEPLAVPAHLRLSPGKVHPLVPRLRARLVLEGDLADEGSRDSAVFDARLAAALRSFEARHGLVPDGRLDAETAAALSVPLAGRVRQLELNLERWRWAVPPGRGRSLLVNVPTFLLHAYDDGREALSMRVVTGRRDTPTPVFGEAMTTVVFRPYWNVPANIAATETLPAVLRDRTVIRRQGLEVVRNGQVVDPSRVDWRRSGGVGFRQRPGAGNALGLVKFLFPNPFNVYLHDTPEDGLFRRTRRTFSHGCVRVEKPEELARWVLEGRGWTAASIAAAMRRGGERGVRLAEPVAVSIGYFTAWVEDDGTVRFLPDVYGHDALQDPFVPPAAAGPARSVALD